MLNDPSFIPKSCIVCGERFDLEKEKNDKSIAGRKRTKTPRIDRELQDQLVPIEGTVPNLTNLPEGCYFAPRCSQAEDICYQQSPPTFILSSDQSVKCWLYNE